MVGDDGIVSLLWDYWDYWLNWWMKPDLDDSPCLVILRIVCDGFLETALVKQLTSFTFFKGHDFDFNTGPSILTIKGFLIAIKLEFPKTPFGCPLTIIPLGRWFVSNQPSISTIYSSGHPGPELRCIALSLLGCLLCGLGFLRFESNSDASELWVDQHSQQMKMLDIWEKWIYGG